MRKSAKWAKQKLHNLIFLPEKHHRQHEELVASFEPCGVFSIIIHVVFLVCPNDMRLGGRILYNFILWKVESRRWYKQLLLHCMALVQCAVSNLYETTPWDHLEISALSFPSCFGEKSDTISCKSSQKERAEQIIRCFSFLQAACYLLKTSESRFGGEMQTKCSTVWGTSATR